MLVTTKAIILFIFCLTFFDNFNEAFMYYQQARP